MLIFQHTRKIFSRFYTQRNHRSYPGSALILFVVSAYAGSICYSHPSAVLIVLLALAQLCFFFTHGRLYKNLFFSVGMFSVAYSYTALRNYSYRAQVSRIAGKKNSFYAHVRDVVPEMGRQKIVLATHALYDEETDAYQRFNSVIHVYSKDSCLLRIGDVIHVQDFYNTPVYHNNYKDYLRRENIHASTHVQKFTFSYHSHQSSWTGRIATRLHALENSLKTKMTGPAYALFKRLFLGSSAKDSFSDTLWLQRYFNNWGIDHFLARSGLHVTLLIFLLSTCLLTLVSGIRLKAIFSCGFLVLYILFSYSSTSFIRACILSGLVQLCFFLIVPLQLLYVFCLTALILLFYNPFSIFFLDFQLTMLITGALCTITHINKIRQPF